MHNSFHQEWSGKIIKKIIDYYQLSFFDKKRILDLGSGNGYLANALARFGSEITCVDIREEKLTSIRKNYPYLKTLKLDLEHNHHFQEFFDVVVSVDILSHLKNAEEHLQHILKFTNYLVLETEVLNSQQDEKIVSVENSSVPEWSFSGLAAKLSETKIEKILHTAGFEFRKFSSKELNTSFYRYDWINTNDRQLNPGNRRFWIAKRSILIDTSKAAENNLLISQQILRPDKPLYQPILSPAVPTTITDLKNLKICCLISGHLRSFEFTFGSLLRNLIQPLNAKVFLSSYNLIGFDIHRGDGNLTNVPISALKDKVLGLLKPESYIFEDHQQFNVSRWGERAPLVRNTQNVLGMFYKIKSANQLKLDYEQKHNMKFDVCIRLRPDLLLKEMIDFNLIRTVGQSVWIPSIYNYGILNDQFAIANSEIMNTYSNCFDNIQQLCDDGTIFHPESLLKQHLIKSRVNIKQFKFNYLLQRIDGSQPNPF